VLPLNLKANLFTEDDGLEGNPEDEAFRQEFLAQMSNVLGFSAPAVKPVVPKLSHLDEAYLIQAEIAHLKTLVDQYREFVSEIAGGPGRTDTPA
jgi:hypothetical protein